jgi:hypothetical protein
MKKLAILAIVAILLPTVAQAQLAGIKQGDPALYEDGWFPYPSTDVIEIVEGESWCYEYIAANMYYLGDGPCVEPLDTFAVHGDDLLGWPVTGDLPMDYCLIYNDTCSYEGCPGDVAWYWWGEVCITAGCPSTVGATNTFTFGMYYCDETMTVQPDSGDCANPNYRGYGPQWQTWSVYFEVVEPSPALVIWQDTLYLVEEGLAAAYVPFHLCNGDLCAGSGDYDYVITSKGLVGAAINQSGTAVAVAPGDCQDIFGVVDAGAALACDYDTLTIVGWDVATGLVYDTCTLPIHVVEPVPIPLFTAPVVTILVLAMILAAAVIMKRHAVSKV